MIQEETSITYSVPTTRGKYRFTVTSNVYGDINVSVQPLSGARVDSYPIEVQRAISTAVSRMEEIMAGISTINGSVVLNDQSQGQVIFSSPLANTDYRVLFSIDDFVIARVSARSTTGFSFELSASLTGTLRYDILI